MIHHAQLFIQNPAECAACVDGLREKLNVNSGDIRLYERESFLIEDARDIARTIWNTPLESEVTLTVIAAHKLNHEAQNALLKVSEEPPAHAYIALIVPSEDMLLPTLRSRFVLDGVSEKREDLELAQVFLGAGSTERKKIVEKIHKNKDHMGARKLIRDLEVVLGKQKDKEENLEALKDVMAFRQYVEQRGAGIKYMLEHLALTLPTLK